MSTEYNDLRRASAPEAAKEEHYFDDPAKGMADGYRAMADRESIKVMVQP